MCDSDPPPPSFCDSCNPVLHLACEDGAQDNSCSLKGNKNYGTAGSCGSSYESSCAYTYKVQLEMDVKILQHHLQEEMELHAILEKALQRNFTILSIPPGLHHHALELLSNIVVLEATVVKLEEELVSLHFQLSQERNERKLAEYRLRHSSSQSLLNYSDAMEVLEAADTVMPLHEMKVSVNSHTPSCQPIDDFKLPRVVQFKEFRYHPCKLSEEMVRCMTNIFISLADSSVPSKSCVLGSRWSSCSPRGHLSNLSLWSSTEHSIISSQGQSPLVDLQCDTDVLAVENTCDPYRVRCKLSWADIGSYRSAIEVSWMSVGKKQLEYAAGVLCNFRVLVEQLAQVNALCLSSDEKLCFWINLYNALMMHAYLAYGVPRSELKHFSLMQKAAYTVGGCSLSAAAIEYIILKMKPPVHRPQIALLLALHKLKVTEEHHNLAVDTYEPLVAFALSCGAYSSPAVRVYNAQNVREQLLEAQHDFIRATVGMSSKGRLLVPKMLHCFARGYVDDEKLAVWISHYLPPHQAIFVQKCMSERRQSLLGPRNCGILPFDTRFRYLFLPENFPV